MRETVTRGKAFDLLNETARNNGSNRIGSPTGKWGYYTFSETERVLDRATLLELDVYGSLPVIRAQTEFGEHIWYLNLQPSVLDPWRCSG